MPKRSKVTDTVFARGVSHIASDINSIEEKHRIMPADLVRGLLESAVAFYREHGFFSFPVVIQPEAFQRGYIAAEDAQSSYGPAKGRHDPGKPPNKSQRHRGDGPRRAVS